MQIVVPGDWSKEDGLGVFTHLAIAENAKDAASEVFSRLFYILMNETGEVFQPEDFSLLSVFTVENGRIFNWSDEISKDLDDSLLQDRYRDWNSRSKHTDQ